MKILEIVDSMTPEELKERETLKGESSGIYKDIHSDIPDSIKEGLKKRLIHINSRLSELNLKWKHSSTLVRAECWKIASGCISVAKKIEIENEAARRLNGEDLIKIASVLSPGDENILLVEYPKMLSRIEQLETKFKSIRTFLATNQIDTSKISDFVEGQNANRYNKMISQLIRQLEI